jgi:hypothetical protein
MGDRRKLQGNHRCCCFSSAYWHAMIDRLGEIERCLKKVTEGVETFEDIWQKVDGEE